MTQHSPLNSFKDRVRSIRARLTSQKHRLAKSALLDMSDPANRRRAMFHFQLLDHACLRILWSNFAQVAPGVFRANHPSQNRVKHYADRGIKTIINLRGASKSPHYFFEAEACRRHNVALIDNQMTARNAPSKESILSLIEIMRSTSKPFLFHCKSGADRSSLAGAIYLLVFCGADIAKARQQFSIRYIHFKSTSTGVLDHILDQYEIVLNSTGIPFEDWVKSGYDADKIQASFNQRRKAMPT